MKSLLAVLAVLLFVPAAASAQPIAPQRDLRNWDQRAPRVVAVQIPGTNVAASDQQSPMTAPVVPVQVRGTNVAASDQQSPKTAPAPVRVAAPASSGFDWGTAAIGAATSLLLTTALFGIGATVRRRHSVITG